MTLKLVSDSNVTELPVGNLNDIVGMMRRVADQIEAGEHGAIESATLVTEGDHGVMSFHWGGTDDAHARLGLLESAKFGILMMLHGEG